MCTVTKALVIFSLLTLLKVTVNGEETDDLVDFEFETQTPTNDYEYADEVVASNHRNTLMDDLGDVETESDGQEVVNFHTKEQKVRAALLKAWANLKLRQKFAEILPILRMLSSQQRTALAALVSAQVNAKPGRELNLSQVKSMFGDRKDLILPLVLDIANLVRFATTTPHYTTYDTFFENEPIPQAQLLRRSFNTQSTVESDERNEAAAAGLDTANPMSNIRDDRLSVEEDDGVIVTTNEGQRSPRQSESRAFLVTREPPHYDKLVQMMPQFEQKLEQDSQKSPTEATDQLVGESRPLPITLTRASPIERNLTLEEIEDLAFESLNGTDSTDSPAAESDSENLPTPEMLIGRKRHRKKPPPSFLYRQPSHLSSHTCERFTGNICLRVDDYPMDQIMGSIRRHSYAMNALLAEYSDKAEEQDADFSDDLLYESKRNLLIGFLLSRREDVNAGQPGAMCNSVIRYARPQKARSATGEWKYIVNTGKHTQTLRLEKCSNPQESCTYLTENFKSRCVQVYNYHRLLSWDNTRGLHVDIFKVPTCCSCRIDGYRDAYPPLTTGTSQYNSYKDTTSKLFGSSSRTKPYAAISENLDDYDLDDEDFEDGDDEDEDDDIAYQFGDGFKRIRKPSKAIVSSSSVPKIRVDQLKLPIGHGLNLQVNTPPEPYLSPPLNEFGELVSFKRGPFTGKRRKRPTSRIDQNLAESATQYREVTLPSTLSTITERPKRRSTVTTTTRASQEKITPRLPNTGLESESGSSRVNYNYHPIIEFFENGAVKGGVEVPQAAASGKESRIGASASDWQPMINETQARCVLMNANVYHGGLDWITLAEESVESYA
ncbi:neurotrophin 1 [Phlebotomus argentipes]|uniref:neurotrophin 1 n=1 Tax=Phlebotomus argentipes TaxID=94469 RepID=UPI002893702C|nr:neurotrophin 1 [Phlebotomus argentipes]